jgi:WhiB family redox-sensing transcriptional regulator
MTSERDDNSNWRRRATCRGMDPEVFYPETPEQDEIALLVCAACPVREACLEDAMRRNETLGTVGGMTWQQRRSYRRKWTAAQKAGANRDMVMA